MPPLDVDELREINGHYLPGRRFPRPIAPGVQWLGGCSAIALDESRPDIRHSQCNSYLVTGSAATLLVDTGHPAFWGGYLEALRAALGGRPLDYVLPTHAEIPHAGSLTFLYRQWPGLTVVGNTQDYHLFHPEVPASACRPMRGSEQRIDLGDRIIEVMPALLKDLGTTVWGFDHRSRVLFVADAFAYMHWHSEDSCGLTMEEISDRPDPERFQFPLTGLSYHDQTATVTEFRGLICTLGVRLIAPAHGTVITDITSTSAYLMRLRDTHRTA